MMMMTDKAPVEYQGLKERLKTECSLHLDKGCLSTYEGDADESKFSGLAEIELVRLYTGEFQPIDVYICETCLEHKTKEGWRPR
jgi:hypothetical protein